MNLELLTDGVPNQKPWLNIVCNRLTANEIVQPVQPISDRYFSAYQSATRTTNNAPLTNLCNTVTLSNPNFNIVANSYTAPSDLILNVTIGTNVGGVPAGADISTSIFFRINGVNTTFITGSRLTIVGSYALCLNGLIKLNAGDVLSYQYNNNTVTAGCTVYDTYFSGFVV